MNRYQRLLFLVLPVLAPCLSTCGGGDPEVQAAIANCEADQSTDANTVSGRRYEGAGVISTGDFARIDMTVGESPEATPGDLDDREGAPVGVEVVFFGRTIVLAGETSAGSGGTLYYEAEADDECVGHVFFSGQRDDEVIEGHLDVSMDVESFSGWFSAAETEEESAKSYCGSAGKNGYWVVVYTGPRTLFGAYATPDSITGNFRGDLFGETMSLSYLDGAAFGTYNTGEERMTGTWAGEMGSDGDPFKTGSFDVTEENCPSEP